MILIDSSGWLEYFTDGANATKFAGPILNNASSKVLVPTVVIYEIFRKILMEKGEELALKVIAQLKKYRIIAFDEDLALSAAKISLDHKIPMADSMIYATALQYKAILWTQDKDFQNLPGVQFLSKN